MPTTLLCSGLLCQSVVPIVSALLLAVLPVTVKTNSGEKIEGELGRIGQSELTVTDVGGQKRTMSFDEITQLTAREVEPTGGPDRQVLLASGSRIAAQTVRTEDDMLRIEPRRQPELIVPLKQVRAVRFRPGSVQTDPEWLGNLDRQARGDTLVIRRPGDRLDPQQGIVLSVDEQTVGFDLDGTTVDAPIDRLEGVIFGSVDQATGETPIQVSDIYGSRWSVASILPSSAGEPIEIDLGAGITHRIPLDQILSIRWTSGIEMLAASEPADSRVATYVQTNLHPNLLADFFGPERHREFDLIFNGGTAVEYRIEAGFEQLAGSVSRAGDVDRSGNVTVRIKLDDQVAWEESLTGADPRGFELPVGDARRLTLEVVTTDDGDLGDRVRFHRPRLLK